jgi:hypothetical protein
MNWIVEPTPAGSEGSHSSVEPQSCFLIFGGIVIWGCLTTILCTDLCIVHCYLKSR